MSDRSIDRRQATGAGWIAQSIELPQAKGGFSMNDGAPPDKAGPPSAGGEFSELKFGLTQRSCRR